jgi:hypothetical protein
VEKEQKKKEAEVCEFGLFDFWVELDLYYSALVAAFNLVCSPSNIFSRLIGFI